MRPALMRPAMVVASMVGVVRMVVPMMRPGKAHVCEQKHRSDNSDDLTHNSILAF
jgi:hypothetical protein